MYEQINMQNSERFNPCQILHSYCNCTCRVCLCWMFYTVVEYCTELIAACVQCWWSLFSNYEGLDNSVCSTNIPIVDLLWNICCAAPTYAEVTWSVTDYSWCICCKHPCCDGRSCPVNNTAVTSCKLAKVSSTKMSLSGLVEFVGASYNQTGSSALKT